MTINKLLLCAAAAMMALSCSKNEAQEAPEQINDGYIRANNSALSNKAASRALVEPTAALSGIQFLRKDNASPSETALDFSSGTGDEAVTSFTGVRAAGASATAPAAITFSPAQPYNNLDKTAYLIGYHPAATTTAADKLSWTLDGKTDIITTAQWNGGRYSSQTNGTMAFNHELCRVEIYIQGATGLSTSVLANVWGNITAGGVQSAPTLELALATQARSFTGANTYLTLTELSTYATAVTAKAIPANGAAIHFGSALVAPNSTNTFNVQITSQTNGAKTDIPVTLEAGGPSNGVMTKGHTHKVTLSFGVDAQDIKASASTIAEWVTGTAGSGNVAQ